MSFARAADARDVALAGQQVLAGAEWPSGCALRVRMGLHVGEGQEREGDYFGPAVNRAARVMGLGHGGQVVTSNAFALIVGTSDLLALGEHQLRGVAGFEPMWQLGEGSFPPLSGAVNADEVAPAATTIRWDGFALDSASRQLSGPDGDLHVEPQVFDVLQLLVDNRDRVVSKEELLDTVWGDQFVSESALTTRIKHARRVLGDSGRAQKYIRNVHGRGYQFVGELETAAPDTPVARQVVVPAPLAPPPLELELALDISLDAEFPFVGRESELDECLGQLATQSSANGQVFVGGAPGVGKSRLAVEVLERAAAAGALVCAGRCEVDVTSGLQAVRDAVSQLAAVHLGRFPEWAKGVEGQLVSLIPSLTGVLPHDPVPTDAYAGIDVFVTVFERMCAEAPAVLLVDDLQWSDEPTRTLLARLQRRLRGRAISVVATYRSTAGELPDDVRDFLQRQRRVVPTAWLDLGDLSAAAAAALVQEVLGQRPDEDIVGLTGGHCLFLTETIRELQLGQATSGSVTELVRARLDRQPADVRAFIQTGAALGPEFDFGVASAASGLDRGVALQAVDAGIEAELLHETASPSRFRFSHQLVRRAVLDSLSRADRASAHLRVAEVLTDAAANAVEVAFHRLAAVPLIPMEEAIQEAISAATNARYANQFDRALRLFERLLVLDIEPRLRAEVLIEVGELINAKGTPALAIDGLDEAAALARQHAWPDLLARAALARWSRSPFRHPSDMSTLELLREADAAIGPEPSVVKARVLAKTAVQLVFRSSLSRRDEMMAEAFDMAVANGADDRELLELLEARAITFSCPAGAAELERVDPEIERLRVKFEDYFQDAASPEERFFLTGNGSEMRRVARPDHDRMAAQPIAEWRDLVLRGSFAAFAGRFEEARDYYERGGEIGDQFWGESAYALHGFAQFFVDLVSGEWQRSSEIMELLAAFDPANVFTGALAVIRARTGNPDGARELLAEVTESCHERVGEHILGGNTLVAAAELALELDDAALADAAEAALLPYAHLVMGVPWSPSLAAADALSRLAARRGDDDAAVNHRATALALYDSLDAPALAARLEAATP